MAGEFAALVPQLNHLDQTWEDTCDLDHFEYEKHTFNQESEIGNFIDEAKGLKDCSEDGKATPESDAAW